jgi:PhoH-like ATPase
VGAKKTFVLDTNVLLFDAQAIYKFNDNDVVIPISVIEEIDRFKKDLNEVGRNARQFSRNLDNLRSKGSLSTGIKIETGGTLRVELNDEKLQLPAMLAGEKADNRILAVAYNLLKKKSAKAVVLLQKIQICVSRQMP